MPLPWLRSEDRTKRRSPAYKPFYFIQYYALDTQVRAMILGMGTVNAPEKGVIGRRFRRLLLFIVIASAVTELIKFLQSHGLLK